MAGLVAVQWWPGVDPVKKIEHQLGLWGLQLLIGGLAITPLRRFAGVNLIHRRPWACWHSSI